MASKRVSPSLDKTLAVERRRVASESLLKVTVLLSDAGEPARRKSVDCSRARAVLLSGERPLRTVGVASRGVASAKYASLVKGTALTVLHSTYDTLGLPSAAGLSVGWFVWRAWIASKFFVTR